MSRKIKYCLVFVAVSIFLSKNAFAQTTQIEGVINTYARVLAVSGNTVNISSSATAMFSANLPDTVLLIQMKGISISAQTNAITNVNNAGMYEFNIVTAVDHATGTVTLQSPVAAEYNTAEMVQIVRVPSYRNAVITGDLTCQPWDRVSATGGVLALLVDDLLTFNANIDVSGKGFRGGAADTSPYNGVACINSLQVMSDRNSSQAGNKGEGAVTVTYTSQRGWGSTATGGGGGNAQWSGGGGGANGGAGGEGGNQSCGEPGFFGGSNSGFSINYNDFDASKRAFMGGGGGTGTGIGSAGGNGGGIVIVVANRLSFANNAGIIAAGNDVDGQAATRAGAGGGGAGGSVLLSVNYYDDNNIFVDIRGGKGGDINVEAVCLDGTSSQGVGGGGGGGVLNTSRNTNFLNNPDRFLFKNELNHGKYTNLPSIEPDLCRYPDREISGGDGIHLENFVVHFNGFFHNYIFTPDTTVCHSDNQTGSATLIRASTPITANEIATFQWQVSTSGNGGWTNISGATGSDLSYQFTEEIYVRRIVTVGGMADTSLPIKISVYEPIVNRIVQIDVAPVFCGATRMEITQMGVASIDPISGGGGFSIEDYTLTWFTAVDVEENVHWTEIRIDNDVITLLDPENVTAFRFRRVIVSNKGCVSYSPEIRNVTVQPTIKNNVITAPDAVCEGDGVVLAGVGNVTGGDGNWTYQWKRRIGVNDEWEPIDHEDARMRDYQPQPIIITDNYFEYTYRRDVTSGKCDSESNQRTVRFDKKPDEPSIITPDNQTLDFIFTFDLEATPPSVGNGLWTSGAGLIFSHPNAPNTTVTGFDFGTYTVYWTVGNGVCVMEPVSITFSVRNVFIPTGFSPNGDGYNDCFRIVGGENASVEVTIFDRYNNVVYKDDKFIVSAEYEDCIWNGNTSSGREAPSGTYFYQIILNGDRTYRGYVVLRR